ncbi:MAG: hypothetical protein K2G44_06365 [Clostridia bacterium]|nr:hypothetical protein [Clostridia bacterium]
MKEIEKYKKNRLIFSGCCCVLSLIILIYFVATICVSQSFDVSCIVAVSVLGGFVLIMLALFVVFDRRRNHLVEKYFGKVSVEDAEKSKELLAKVNSVLQGHYAFLYHNSEFEFDPKILKYDLKQISKGHKVYVGRIKVWFDMQAEIENSPERDLEENKIFNAYIQALADLFERNQSDI